MLSILPAMILFCLIEAEPEEKYLPANTVVTVVVDRTNRDVQSKEIELRGKRSDPDKIPTRIVFDCQESLDALPDLMSNLVQLESQEWNRMAKLNGECGTQIADMRATSLSVKFSWEDDGRLEILVFPSVSGGGNQIIRASALTPEVWIIDGGKLVLKSKARNWQALSL